MAPVSTSVPAAVVLKAVRGWRLFPCRTEIDRAVMAAHPSQPAGSTGCRWLMLAAEMAGLAGGSWRSPPDPARTGWACPPRIATRALSAQAGSVRAARYFTLATLRRWGTAHSSQDIAIVVSEMVTNALRHALPGPGDTGPRRPVRLGLLQQGPWVLCAVADPGNSGSGAANPRFAGRGRPRAADDLRVQRPVGLHHARRGGKGRVGHVHRTARTAFPGPVPGQARPRPGAGNSTLTTGTKTARGGPRAQSRPGGRGSAMLIPALAPPHWAGGPGAGTSVGRGALPSFGLSHRSITPRPEHLLGDQVTGPASLSGARETGYPAGQTARIPGGGRP